MSLGLHGGPFRDPWDHRSAFAICCYVEEPRTWIPGELVTSGMMNSIRDLFLEIEAGTAQLIKATLVGDTSVNLAALVSDSGEAAIAYDTTQGQIVASVNGGSYVPLSGGLRQVFRGLSLRTHPNGDTAASKVYLNHADEIIMDSGHRVSDWDDLSADITVGGAGGLDTGAEGASRWYDIYAIRKSSDGTKNLLLHRAKSFDLDTSFTTTPDSFKALRKTTSTETDKLAQGVTFASGGELHYVDVTLQKANSPTGNIWFTLEANSAGSPSGAALATSDKIDVSQVSTSNQVIRFIFRVPATVTATQYHLVLQGDYTKSDTVNVRWAGVTAGGYAGGVAKSYNGAAWSAVADPLDFYFKAYLKQNDTTVTMPSGYDQSCLVGHVYNDGSSNFRAFTATDKRVRLFTSVSSGDVAASTPPTLIDFASVVPPIPVVLLQLNLAPQGAAAVAIMAGAVPNGFRSTLTTDTVPTAMKSWGTPADNAYGIGLIDFNTETQAFYLYHNGASAGRAYGTGYTW